MHMTLPGTFTLGRRAVLGSAAACLAARPRGAFAASPDQVAYVGGYTPNGAGIGICRMDRATGRLSQTGVVTGTENPSWLALHPSRRTLYAVNEIKTFQGKPGASVTSFQISSGGELAKLDVITSDGLEPAHLSVHPDGRFVLVANYRSGTVAVLPVRPDGSLAQPADTEQDSGPGGPPVPSSGPSGMQPSGDSDGHPHAHMIAADPTGRFVLVDDLGLDRLYVWRFDALTGKLHSPSITAASPGSGPRHFAFHPNGHVLYNLLEESSQITVLAWDGRTGGLARLQTVSTLPAGFAGSNLAAEILVSPDGRFVYASNRLHNSVALFATDRAGTLHPTGHEWVRGDYPRHLSFDPAGRFLFVCNQRSDDITSFRIDPGTGALAFTGAWFPYGSPTNLTFLS